MHCNLQRKDSIKEKKPTCSTIRILSPSHLSPLFSNIYWKNSYSLITSEHAFWTCSLQPTPVRVQYQPCHQNYSSVSLLYWPNWVGQIQGLFFFFLSFYVTSQKHQHRWQLHSATPFLPYLQGYHGLLVSLLLPKHLFLSVHCWSLSSVWPLNIYLRDE